MEQAHVRFVGTVARHPNIVGAQGRRGMDEVVVDKLLAHIEHRLTAASLFHPAHPHHDFAKHFRFATHLRNLFFRRLQVQHGRQVGTQPRGFFQEEPCLLLPRAAGSKEVVTPRGNAVTACLPGVGGIVAVHHAAPFRGLDVDEGNGIVHLSFDPAARPQPRDAQLLPVDGVPLAANLMLVARDVDAVDAVGGVDHPFTLETPIVPPSAAE